MMSGIEWSEWNGMRRLIGSLVWRGALATALYAGGLYGFHFGLQVIGATPSPRMLLKFCWIAGVVTGVVVSWGLTERAGFASILVTLPAVIMAALAILVGTSLALLALGSPLDVMMRFLYAGGALLTASIVIVLKTMLE